MGSKVYTRKQLELLRMWQRGELKRLNVLEGSVRSGKTWISLVLWAFWVSTMPKEGSYLMVAKTITSLRRNVLDLLTELVGGGNFSYSLSKKEGRLFGRLVYLEGVNDARSEGKIRGMTLTGAYCDELTLFTKDFFAMLLSRLSVSGAKLFATTNPDSPNHWLMTDYFDRAEHIDLLRLKFTIDDNDFLPPDYVANLKREYTGVFYKRFVDGEWCVAEGLVYQFGAENIVSELPEVDGARWYISCDYGTLNPFSAGLWRVADGSAVRVREYYYSGRDEKHQKTDEEYYAELEALAGEANIKSVIVDPSAASFITTIRKHGRFTVRKANNDVIDGIRYTATLLQQGKVKIHERCRNAIREFGLYAWDEKAGVDRPIKENDHAMDEIRYLCMTVMRRQSGAENTFYGGVL